MSMTRGRKGGEMTKILATAMVAMLLLAGTQAAFASCAADAAAARAECLRGVGGDRARAADCAAEYRDDLAECHRYEPAPMMHRPAPMPMHQMPMHPMPVSPPPGHR
jgi:hypothetical protein